MFARCQIRSSNRCWIIGPLSAVMAAALPGCVTTTHIVGQMNGPTARVQTKVTGANSYSDAGPVSADEAATRYFNLTHEWLAQVKVVLDLYVLHTEPRYLGAKEDVN